MEKINFRKALALTSAFFYILVGSHGAAKAEGLPECSPVDYTVEFNVLPQYANDFKMVVCNFYNNGMSKEAFMGSYLTLGEYQRVNQRRASVRILNGEKVSIDDIEDYSEVCEDETDKALNHGNVVRNIELYNIMCEGGIPVPLEVFASKAFSNMNIIGDQASRLTPGGLWLNNNAGYTHEQEAWHVYFERVIRYERYLLSERENANKIGNQSRVDEINAILALYGDGHFEEWLFRYFDESVYNETNLFVPREDVDMKAFNNGDCMPVISALIDQYNDLKDRITTANMMIPILLPSNCNEETKGCSFYDAGNERILAFIPDQEKKL